MQNCICFLVNNDIFYYEQMVDLTALLLKYSCSNSKYGFSIIIYSQIEICSISMCLEMVLQAKNIYIYIYMHGKNVPPSGSFSVRFKAKLQQVKSWNFLLSIQL